MSAARTATVTVTLALGFAMLLLGRALLAIYPAPSADTERPWAIPAALQAWNGYFPGDFRASADPIPVVQTVTLEFDGRPYRFQRFAHSVERADADLVPWFPDLHNKQWIRVGSARVEVEGGPPIAVLALERMSGAHALVLAYSYRTGPYASTSFNIAKLLQVPAKLGAHNRFEILTVAAPCSNDCGEVSRRAAQVLTEILSANPP